MEQQQSLRIIQRSPTTASVVFGKEDLVWDITIFSKTSHQKNEFDLFEQINNYWKGKPLEFQQQVFNLYKKTHAIFEFGGTIETLTLELKPYINEFFKLHKPETLTTWAKMFGNIFISPSLPNEYIGEDSPNASAARFFQAATKNKTYDRRDYINLVGLAIVFRMLIPIFGEFIFLTQASARTNLKEYRAGKLLEGTVIEESEAYNKLRLYVNENIQVDKQKAGPILDGINSEEFPHWQLYMVIVRRLMVGNIKGDPSQPNSHLVTFIHFYLSLRMQAYEYSFSSGKVRDKDIDSSSNESDDKKPSIFEIYKTPTVHSPGDYEQMAFYAQDIEWAISVLCPGLDRDIYNQAVEANRFMAGPIPFHMPQAILVQNLIGPFQAPQVLEHITRLPALGLYNVVQAMLWQYGYRDLAAFLTTTVNDNHSTISGFTHNTRMNIPRVMSDKIRELYPHLKQTSSRSANSKVEPTPMITIKNIIEMMSSQEWKMNICDDWINQLNAGKVSPSRRRDWIIPADIRIQLARLFIQIGMYRVPFHPDSIADFAKQQF